MNLKRTKVITTKLRRLIRETREIATQAKISLRLPFSLSSCTAQNNPMIIMKKTSLMTLILLSIWAL